MPLSNLFLASYFSIMNKPFLKNLQPFFLLKNRFFFCTNRIHFEKPARCTSRAIRIAVRLFLVPASANIARLGNLQGKRCDRLAKIGATETQQGAQLNSGKAFWMSANICPAIKLLCPLFCKKNSKFLKASQVDRRLRQSKEPEGFRVFETTEAAQSVLQEGRIRSRKAEIPEAISGRQTVGGSSQKRS